MKFATHEEFSEFVFNKYMMFGKYSVQDKYMVEAFYEIEIDSVDDFLDAAKLVVLAAKNPHPHLELYDYEFVAKSINSQVCKIVAKFSDSQFDELFEKLQEIVGDDSELFYALSEF